eukprot:scaffold485644_cov52-Prasinocladus_malaysianus.AAC.2
MESLCAITPEKEQFPAHANVAPIQQPGLPPRQPVIAAELKWARAAIRRAATPAPDLTSRHRLNVLPMLSPVLGDC